MSQPTTPTADKVTQADRDAAGRIVEGDSDNPLRVAEADEFYDGNRDDDPLVQEQVRKRLATPGEDDVERAKAIVEREMRRLPYRQSHIDGMREGREETLAVAAALTAISPTTEDAKRELVEATRALMLEMNWVNEQLDLMPDDLAEAQTRVNKALASIGDAPKRDMERLFGRSYSG